jgi:hypothetical protein
MNRRIAPVWGGYPLGQAPQSSGGMGALKHGASTVCYCSYVRWTVRHPSGAAGEGATTPAGSAASCPLIKLPGKSVRDARATAR